MLTGQNGILNRATEAKEKTETASKDEKRKLAQAEALMNTDETTYKGITLPEGFVPTKIEGEDSIDDGLVITDGYGNEYVWVEVPKTTEVYSTAGLSVTDFSDEEYGKIESDLHSYTGIYRKEPNYKDKWYDASGDLNETNKLDWYQSEKDYNIAKQKMLKSVYQNGGFWVGRYEVGIDSDKEKIRYYGEDYYTKHEATQKPVIKANCYPYNWVRRSQAQVLARSMSTNDYSCSLMYGVQWDLMLKYIEEKSVKKETGNKDNVRSEIQLKLCSDSTTIGNYNNSQFIITNIKVKDASVYGLKLEKYPYEKNSSNTILLTTGASDNFSYCNIYDIAGNVWEWTLENFDGEKMHCTYNGGDYNVSGKKAPANCRNENNSNFSSNIGFRVFLY